MELKTLSVFKTAKYLLSAREWGEGGGRGEERAHPQIELYRKLNYITQEISKENSSVSDTCTGS